MSHLTPTQAQWVWFSVVAATVVFYVALDVFMNFQFGPDTTLSRCHRRLICQYPATWVAIIAIIFYYLGHVGTPCE